MDPDKIADAWFEDVLRTEALNCWMVPLTADKAFDEACVTFKKMVLRAWQIRNMIAKCVKTVKAGE